MLLLLQIKEISRIASLDAQMQNEASKYFCGMKLYISAMLLFAVLLYT